MKNCRELEPQVNFRATEKLEKMPKIRGLNEGAVTLEERGLQDESGENRWNPTTVYIGTSVPLNHNQKVPGDRQGTSGLTSREKRVQGAKQSVKGRFYMHVETHKNISAERNLQHELQCPARGASVTPGSGCTAQLCVNQDKSS